MVSEAEETLSDLRRDQMSLVYWIQFMGCGEDNPGKWMVNEHEIKKYEETKKLIKVSRIELQYEHSLQFDNVNDCA